MKINVNGRAMSVKADGDTPLLWVLRDHLDMTGTKYGCGQGICGACTVHVDGEVTRSCQLALEDVGNQKITTIEGQSDRVAKVVQEAWVEKNAPQCGYCQPGFMMATAALLEKIPEPSDEDIDQNIINICRCATYYRMRKAIHRAAQLGQSANQANS